MKTNILSLLIIATIFLAGCNSANNNSNKNPVDSHQHKDGDGHDHANEKDHNHSENDGHDHSDDKERKLAAGVGNNYGGSGEEGEHSDEIAFTKKQADAVGLKTETVLPGVFRHVIKTSGQIQTSQGDEATIVATSNGVVSFVNPSISDGDAIRTGEAIVVISAKNLQEGDPAVKVKIAYETARKEYNRAEELIKDKIISAKEFEQIRLRYETAKTAYEAQASNITASGIKVTSPISGYIKNRLVSQGAYVSVGQPVATVAQNKKLQLRAEVSENNFKYLKNINSANFRPAYDNTVYKLSELNGRLLSFGKVSSNTSFYIPVTFEFDNIGDIVPGSFIEVFLLAAPQDNVISVPVSAITEEQGLYFVYLQIEDEAYKKQEVTLGRGNGERVQILAGLKEGDKVVTKGTYQVKLAATSSVMPEGHSH